MTEQLTCEYERCDQPAPANPNGMRLCAKHEAEAQTMIESGDMRALVKWWMYEARRSEIRDVMDTAKDTIRQFKARGQQ